MNEFELHQVAAVSSAGIGTNDHAISVPPISHHGMSSSPIYNFLRKTRNVDFHLN